MATTLTSKGQVTIPKPVRDHLGLKPGSSVEFELAQDGRVTLKAVKARSRPSAFSKLRGSNKGKLTTDQIMALTRG